jgi:uncharacterized damage-inducible protein DinB
MLSELHELFEYNRWANARTLDAVACLSPEQLRRELGGSFPSIWETLVHLASADWIWLRRWHGEPAPALPSDWEFADLQALRRRWEEVEQERERLLSELTESTLARPVHAITRKGDSFMNPLGQTLRHVVNHSTYHRGQVATMMRQVGAVPAATDLILFYRSRNDRE